MKRRTTATHRTTLAQKGLIVLIILFAIGIFYICSYIEHTYTREAIAYQQEDGSTLFVDTTGNEWIVDTEENYDGQEVKLVMNDNCTISDITDDIITKVKLIK